MRASQFPVPLALGAALAAAASLSVLAPPTIAAQAPGAFVVEQAARGRAVYEASCVACHGADLKAAGAPPLAGDAFIRSWSARALTADDLLYVVSTTMPKGASARLPRQDYLDVVAYLLQRNGYVAGSGPLRDERAALQRVRLEPQGAAHAPPATSPSPGTTAAVHAPTTLVPSQADLLAPAAAQWPAVTRDYAGTRFSPLTQITPDNVATLRVVCAYQVGEPGNFQSIPVVYDGTLYVTTARTTVALDARTCRPRWKHTWKPVGPEAWPVPNNRGVAIKDGRVVRGTVDGYLFALDAATGTLLWSRRAADAEAGESFTMPPLVHEDLVFIGPAGSENNIKGWVGAFRLADGTPVWRFDVIRDRATWKGRDSIPTGGGAVWTPFTFDAATGTLYVATTNPAPDFAGDVRDGDNLHSNSVLALDARTGGLRWAKQLVPHDTHDWDLTHAGPLYTVPAGADSRDLLASVGKDGLLRAIDRRTRAVVWETAVTRRENAEAPVTKAGTRACPGVLGGVEWSGPAYSARTGLLYVNAVDWCTTFTLADEVRHVPGRLYFGGSTLMDPQSTWGGWLTAVDAATGAVRWRYRSAAPLVAGVAATAGDVVFTGELTGDALALDARTGAVRWRFNTGGPIGGGVATYAVEGTQYVAIASGKPSGLWVAEHPGAATVFVFALPDR